MTPTTGTLTERVRFERRESADDGYGNTLANWQTLIRSRSVSLRPSRGGEEMIAQRAQGVSLWDMWVRSDLLTRSVTPDDRVVDARDENRVFNIKFAEDMDGRRAWILMQLELGKADG